MKHIVVENVDEMKNYCEENVCFEERVSPKVIQEKEKQKVPFRIKVKNFILFPVPLGAILLFIILSAQIAFDIYAFTFMNLF